MWGASSSPGWRHSATTWWQWSGDVQAASRRLPSGIALRVADYEDASALNPRGAFRQSIIGGWQQQHSIFRDYHGIPSITHAVP